MGRAPPAAGILAVIMAIAEPHPLRAETVYEFAVNCHEDELAQCFDRIRERLDRVKAKQQGHAFCLPRAWGMPEYLGNGYPVSILEHIRLSLSAARFGKAEEPVDDAISDILKRIYPCE